MIKAVVFDFGQTLVDSADGFRAAEKELEQKAFEVLSAVSWVEFVDIYRQIRTRLHGRSLFSRRALLEELFAHHGRKIDPVISEQWEADYWRKVKTMTRPFAETEGVLQGLLDQGRRLALITNTQGQGQEGNHRLSDYPQLERFFEEIVVAGESGIPAKPDPEPFRLCLARLMVKPVDAVYVGDDWRIDVLGSESAGMHPVWLQHRSVKRNWPTVETEAPVIDSLESLLDIESLIFGKSR